MSTEPPRLTILVTGIGAIIGQGLVRSLRAAERPLRIVGLDRNPLALGRRTCDAFYVKPDVGETDPAYTEFLLRLFKEEGVNLVFPGIEQDVFFFDGNRRLFEGGPAIVLNDSRLIRLSADKWLMHEALLEAGLPAIPTTISPVWEACVAQLGEAPWLFKPRRGSGSRGQARVEDKEDLAYIVRKNGANFMLQAYVGSDDQEYTVGLFGLGDGRSTAPAILRRTLGPSGATWTAETVRTDPAIEDFCARLTRQFQPLGPTNYQFRKSGDRVWLLEINPRFSSSNSLRTGLGFNEALMSVEYYCDGREPKFGGLLPGRASRYVEDLVELQC